MISEKVPDPFRQMMERFGRPYSWKHWAVAVCTQSTMTVDLNWVIMGWVPESELAEVGYIPLRRLKVRGMFPFPYC